MGLDGSASLAKSGASVSIKMYKAPKEAHSRFTSGLHMQEHTHAPPHTHAPGHTEIHTHKNMYDTGLKANHCRDLHVVS